MSHSQVRLGLLTAATAVLATCARTPEVRLASELDGLRQVLDAHANDPTAAARALRAQLRDRLPDLARALGDALTELDAVTDPARRAERMRAMVAVVEPAMRPLQPVLAAAIQSAPRVLRSGADAASAGDPLGRVVVDVWRRWTALVRRVGTEFPDSAMGQEARKAKSDEAIDALDRLCKSSAVYFTVARTVGASGEALPCQFPSTVAVTPAIGPKACCSPPNDKDGDRRCDVRESDWQNASWRALDQ